MQNILDDSTTIKQSRIQIYPPLKLCHPFTIVQTLAKIFNLSTNNNLKSRLGTKYNGKCTIISFFAISRNHRFLGIEGNFGRWLYDSGIVPNFFVQKLLAVKFLSKRLGHNAAPLVCPNKGLHQIWLSTDCSHTFNYFIPADSFNFGIIYITIQIAKYVRIEMLKWCMLMLRNLSKSLALCF